MMFLNCFNRSRHQILNVTLIFNNLYQLILIQMVTFKYCITKILIQILAGPPEWLKFFSEPAAIVDRAGLDMAWQGRAQVFLEIF